MKAIVGILIAVLLTISSAVAETAAVVNMSVKTGEITRSNARAIYLMKSRRWDDGSQIILFQMPHTSAAHKQFVREVLEMSPERYAREWDRLVNAGLSGFVRVVNTESEMLRKVANTEHSLGYIDAYHLVVHDEQEGVKTIKIVD